MSPWSFSFAAGHQSEIANLHEELLNVFVVLVCGADGIACLNYAEYKQLLDEDFRPVEWIKVSRRPREKYHLSGSDSVVEFTISDNEYPAKVHMALAQIES